MAKKLTAAAIERYRPAKERREIRDSLATGLYLCVEASGSKSWVMRFRRPDGRGARLTIGSVDFSGATFKGEPIIGTPLSLSAARQLAAMIHRSRERGEDVIADRKTEKRRKRLKVEQDAANTFAAAARAFIDEHARLKNRRWRETATVLGWDYTGNEPAKVEAGLSARWSNKPVISIDEDDCFEIIDEAGRSGIPGTKPRTKGYSHARARGMHNALSSMFGWLRKKRKVKSNPCTGIDLEPAAKRDRVLDDDEIRWFWTATEAADAPRIEDAAKPYTPALRLLLLTGQRLNEIAKMRRAELQAGELHLPGERTKNGLPHVVPLAPQALALIPEGKGEYVFSTSFGQSAIHLGSKAKTRIDAAMLAQAQKERGKSHAIPPWRLHDLRRTAVTGMRRLKISSDVVEAVINHVSGAKAGVAGIYDRHDLMEDRREALTRWANYIEGLISPKPTNVVPLDSKVRRAQR